MKKTFATHGLPPLAENPTGSHSTASKNEGHKEANLNVGSFGVLQALKLEGGEGIWAHYNDKGKEFAWSTESDVQSYVKVAIISAIHALGLALVLDCRDELSIFKVRPDIWILTKKGGIPVGVIEVKKPNEKIMEEKLVHGQIYDYMLRLQSFYGIQNVFGIVTTYHQWRIYWLPQSQDIAQAQSINENFSIEVTKDEILIDEKFTENDENEEEEYDKKNPREVYGTKVIESSNPDLPKILGSVIKKMYYTKTEKIERFNPSRPYIVMDKDTWYWSTVKWNPSFKPNYHVMPKSQPKKLYLIEDFRGGVDGRVWLASTPKGEMCVIKFDHSDKFDDLKKEADNWKTLYADKTYTQMITLCGRPALMMPYGKPINNLKQTKDVENLLEYIAKMGMIHMDLKPSHFVFQSPAQYFTIDNRNVVPRPQGLTEGDAYNLMIKKLFPKRLNFDDTEDD